jgi:hypothetical protein
MLLLDIWLEEVIVAIPAVAAVLENLGRGKPFRWRKWQWLTLKREH